MLKAAARENAAWVNGTWAAGEAAAAAQGVRDVFYVRTPPWQQSVLTRGLDAISRGLVALATQPETFVATKVKGWSPKA